VGAGGLLLATGDARYADHMERILYNGFAGATATGGARFFYVNPLQRRADHFEKDDPGRRREWFSCACCPPNVMRLTASLQHYLATVAGDTLFVHLFTSAALAASLAGGELGVRVDTGYPWSGAAEIRVARGPPPGRLGWLCACRPGPPSAPCAERRAGVGRVRRRGVPGAEPAVAARRCAAV